ncbi:ABC transporter substrate-binding protein [Paenibacillus sp. PL91]|uniref:ABC transporter substrate-binding protein n=1 Tax=Paenibacillus sp. PL91 TaxID=2729538 RepID=UPI00145D220F|nr:ABC transporter substrate-binding protein [Paenibacillus sp. PL91]MBC9199125.1 SgrR family transcriptional regulator [Paenibacillus sp. PL91]
MLTHERYLLLYTKFAGADGAGKAVEVSLEQLADALFCSTRNVKLILRKLEEEGFIDWTAGRGRGNRSQITFLLAKEKKLLELAQQLATKSEYKQAFEFIDRYGEGTAARSLFAEWLNGHFGYRTMQMNDIESDILRLPVHRPILTLDPKELYYAFSAHMIKQLFDCLVQYDRVAGRVIPSLAHAWEHDGSGKVWTFHLRKGVMFHHGRELIAEDVVYTLNRLHGSSASGWFVRTIEQVEAIGQRTVKIKLSNPNWLFPRFLCAPGLSIVPHELVEQDEFFWTRPVGTGPFRFTDWTADRFTMQANAGYFQGRAHLDGVVIVIMPEDTVVYTKSWEQLLIDHDIRDIQPEQGWKKIESICNGCSLLTWNMGKEGPQQSEAFRKAIDLLVDRTQMIKELGEDRIYPAQGFHPNEATYQWQDQCESEQAVELLKASGYDGRAIRISTYGIHEQDALWLQRHLSAFGIEVVVQVENWRSIREPEVFQNADCLLYCVVFAEDEVCLIELYEQTGNFLREHLDPRLRGWVKEKIDLALACERAEDRWNQLFEIEKKLKDETHVLFLLHKKLNTFYNPNIKGVGVNSLGWIDFKDIWLERTNDASQITESSPIATLQ